MDLFDVVAEVLTPWAFECFADSVYVERANVGYVRAHLAKRGWGHARVYQRGAT